MRQLFTGVRSRLILIGVLAGAGFLFSVSMAIIGYWDNGVRQTERRALDLASLVATEYRVHFESAEALLRTLATNPVLREGTLDTCTAELTRLDEQLRPLGYSWIRLLDADGRTRCAGSEVDQRLDHAQLPVVQNAVARGGFALGAHRLEGQGQDAVIPAAYPVVGDDGVIAVGISIGWLNASPQRLALQEDITVHLIGEAGTIVAQYPPAQDDAGDILAGTPVVEEIVDRRAGAVRLDVGSGGERIVGFVPLGGDSGVFVAASLPRSTMAEWILDSWHGPYVIFIILFIVLMAVTGGGIYLTILRNISRLFETARKLSAGDLSARTGLSNEPGEFGVLARQIDDMVEALEERDERIATYTRKLETANKDLEQFAYIASHDLKAPLRGIDHLVQWLEEDLEEVLTDDSRNNMHRLRLRVVRLESLMDALLKYSRAGRMKEQAEDVDAGKVLNEAVSLLDPPKGFVVEADGALPTLHTTKVALQTVFSNLIGNAIKHHDRDSGRITVSADRHGDVIEFAVSDDGPGIPADYHERIFQVFQRLQSNQEKEGSGIGLSIVKRLVDSHGGQVRVESAADQRGTTFRFTWVATPVSEDASEATPGHETGDMVEEGAPLAHRAA